MKKKTNTQFNIQKIIGTLQEGKLLTESLILKLCHLVVSDIIKKESNIVKVQLPITICGDIHGQFHDLLQLFQLGGELPFTNYLFLGDYVDRGCIVYLLALKLKYPQQLTILRGNHECRSITQVYGFYDECIRKYGNSNVWKELTNLFDYLPIISEVDNSYFCLHGGLSPKLEGETMESIQNYKRVTELENDTLLSDFVWADPDDKPGFNPSPRGTGFTFGEDQTKKFLHKNKLKKIYRAHQLIMEGYSYTHKNQVMTIFSAPNYCYSNRCGNLAAIMMIDEYGNEIFQKYEASEQNNNDANSIKRIPDYFL